jgi:hypothetical protein
VSSPDPKTDREICRLIDAIGGLLQKRAEIVATSLTKDPGRHKAYCDEIERCRIAWESSRKSMAFWAHRILIAETSSTEIKD